MPQISKIRIVNFQYNDGKRLIADELFDFERKDSGPSDVLINLANGGGKSVLVQLMMQPIIPKAKVAGRRIESFFKNNSDHCFVAIEWLLDGSKMKLMTGIAMASSDSSRDSDSDRGFQIKYYTFISSYEDYRTVYNIKDLPLSRKEEGKYIAASFDDIRNLAKKSGGELDRFASDDSVRWQERLSQYGIIQNEWRMIEELNSNEDGLSKYFSSLKTSDAVIDKLIIPRIEEKHSSRDSKDDNSLETMLISYSRQFAKQKDSIKEKNLCSDFLDLLAKTKPEAENLWKSNDSLESCIKDLFAYYDAIIDEIGNKESQKEALEADKNKLDEQISHIKWEKASAEYYRYKEVKERETTNLEEAESRKTEAKEKRDNANKKLRLMECAKYYKQWEEIDNKIKALSIEIDNKEKNSQSAKDLASLKYSAFLEINSELEEVEPEMEKLSKEKNNLNAELDKLESDILSLSKNIEDENNLKNKANTLLEKQQEDNDKTVQVLGIDAERMLDGKYQEQDLEKWKRLNHNQEQTLISDLSDTESLIEELEHKKESLPQEIAETKINLNDFSKSVENKKNKLDIFRAHKKQVQNVFKKHNLSEDMIFTDHAIKFIQEQISIKADEIKKVAVKIDETDDEIDAVKQGTLHIPKIISNFLNGTGLRYHTVENYILNQKATKSLSLEEGQKLLEKYPFMAYGIIVDAKDVDTIKEEARDKWFPSILPIFTPSDVEQLITGEATPFSAISAYSKKYFLNHDGFSEELNKVLKDLNDRKALLESIKRGLDEDLKLLEDFTVYNDKSEWQLQSEIEKLNGNITKEKARISDLNKKLVDVKGEIGNLCKKKETQQQNLREIQSKLSKFEELIRQIAQEEQLRNDYATHSRKVQHLTHNRKEKEKNKTECENQRKEKKDRLEELNDLNRKLDEGLEKVSGATEAEVIDGKWSDLLAQYEELLERQSKNLQELIKDKNKLFEEKEDKQKEINKRECKQEEYENLIYSESREEEARKAEKEYETKFEKAESDYNNIKGIAIRAESDYENAVKGLDDFNGEPLPKNEVGSSYESRVSEIRSEIIKCKSEIKKIESNLSSLRTTKGKVEGSIEKQHRPAKYDKIILEENYDAQLVSLKAKISDCQKDINLSKETVEKILKEMSLKFSSKSNSVDRAICNMKDLLSNTSIGGDRYYTLVDHIDANMHTAKLRISQIETDLEELNETKGDLIRQCVMQGKQMYEGLQQLSNNSRVKVQDKRRAMIKFVVPAAIDENIARTSIANEIEKGAEEIASKFAEDSYLDSEVRKIASRIVGSKSLLRKYIGVENIVLNAYKIDRNPENSGYRDWGQTQVNNSGAEKFVVYFAVILALMAYAREEQGDFDGKNNRSVLILDNPFGPISSKHVLEPMFEIAKNYKVQMICLSDISKSDIISCFNLVIRAIVKQFTFSNKEQLTHEGNESIEHGFYRSEQMSLW